MAERVTSELGSNPKPEQTVSLNGSRADIYDFQGIMSASTSNELMILRRADFNTPIESATISVARTTRSTGDLGYQYGAIIKLDESRSDIEQVQSQVLRMYLGDVSGNDRSTRIGNTILEATPYNQVFRVTGDSGIRALIYVASHQICISNKLGLQGKIREQDVTVKVEPNPEGTVEELKIFSDFLQVFMYSADIAAGGSDLSNFTPRPRRLNRIYPIGLQRTVLPNKQIIATGDQTARKEQEREKEEQKSEFEPSTPVQEVMLDDVIVPDYIKKNLRDVVTSFKHPEIMKKWGAERPQGILLYGEPGTGKTMLVTAIAHELGAELMEIRGGDLYQKWLGESEKKMQEVFSVAKKSTGPLVLFFDEFESIIGITAEPSSGGSDSAKNAVAGIFKVEMNTLRKQNPNVMVIGVTNFPDRVDESLIRSGRIDLKFYIPMPDESSRKKILMGIIRKSERNAEAHGLTIFGGDINIGILAEQSDTMSGADLDEVFRRLKFDKAMREAQELEKPLGQRLPTSPITQYEIMDEIIRFRQNKSAR